MSMQDKSAAETSTGPDGLSNAGAKVGGRARPDAFVSYRRLPDYMRFVDKLQKALRARGKYVWVDRTDVEPATDFWERIRLGIEAAKAFIFVITPESVTSKECLDELALAIEQHKAIIPVYRRKTNSKILPSSLPIPEAESMACPTTPQILSLR